MAETTPVATTATPLPSDDAIERASKFTREPFVSEGDDPASTLALGTAHRRALDTALAEIEAGNKVPSVGWRRNFSLLLGLERLLSQDEPTLVDGTVLSAHQVDALSGTLTALLAELQRNGNGSGNGAVADDELQLAPVGIPGEEELDEDEPDEPMDWDEPAAADDEQLP
jgi:ribonuclease E